MNSLPGLHYFSSLVDEEVVKGKEVGGGGGQGGSGGARGTATSGGRVSGL